MNWPEVNVGNNPMRTINKTINEGVFTLSVGMRQSLEIQFFLSNLSPSKSHRMKNLIVLALICTILSLSFSSCSKCYTCNFNGDVREICSKDLPDGNAGLNLTIQAYEDQGYKCIRK